MRVTDAARPPAYARVARCVVAPSNRRRFLQDSLGLVGLGLLAGYGQLPRVVCHLTYDRTHRFFTARLPRARRLIVALRLADVRPIATPRSVESANSMPPGIA